METKRGPDHERDADGPDAHERTVPHRRREPPDRAAPVWFLWTGPTDSLAPWLGGIRGGCFCRFSDIVSIRPEFVGAPFVEVAPLVPPAAAFIGRRVCIAAVDLTVIRMARARLLRVEPIPQPHPFPRTRAARALWCGPMRPDVVVPGWPELPPFVVDRLLCRE